MEFQNFIYKTEVRLRIDIVVAYILHDKRKSEVKDTFWWYLERTFEEEDEKEILYVISTVI